MSQLGTNDQAGRAVGEIDNLSLVIGNNPPAIDTDFSQDPGFTTTDPSDFYWNPGASASGDCGAVKSDWRLPNRNELNSLVDIQYGGPALCNAAGTGHWSEGDPFTSVTLATPDQVPYFTSSTYSTFSGHAWIVDMNTGEVVKWQGVDPSKLDNCYVWPVRGGH